MTTPSDEIRELTTRLLAAGHDDGNAAARVTDELRVALSRFAGRDGFAALLRRAVMLARAENPALTGVKFDPSGELEELENADAKSGAAILTHLLWLLVTFIGHSLTLQIVREIWPDAMASQGGE